MKKPPIQKFDDFFNSDPLVIEQNDDGSLYIPIWQVEKDLDFISNSNWSRAKHQYAFHADHSGEEWLSTSCEVMLTYSGMERILLCSSIISPKQYPMNQNILQTGIAEATKAGVKILGRRFGNELNARNIPKTKKVKDPIKSRPDNKVMSAYLKAIAEKDETTIERLLKRYDIKTEISHA